MAAILATSGRRRTLNTRAAIWRITAAIARAARAPMMLAMPACRRTLRFRATAAASLSGMTAAAIRAAVVARLCRVTGHSVSEVVASLRKHIQEA